MNGTTDTPDARYVTGDYQSSYPTWHAEDSPWKARQILRVFEPSANAGLVRICEVGCGVGGVLAAIAEQLGQRGVPTECTGFDIAPLAIERARKQWKERAGLRFECVDVLTLERLNYDVCLLVDVLEHLEDPRRFVRALIARGLRNFIVHLPLENHWLAIIRGKTDPRTNTAGHLHFFDTASALSLIERSDLEVIRWIYTPELDLDLKLHRTLRSVLAYVPRKLLLTVAPRFASATIGGTSLMAQCRVRA